MRSIFGAAATCAICCVPLETHKEKQKTPYRPFESAMTLHTETQWNRAGLVLYFTLVCTQVFVSNHTSTASSRCSLQLVLHTCLHATCFMQNHTDTAFSLCSFSSCSTLACARARAKNRSGATFSKSRYISFRTCAPYLCTYNLFARSALAQTSRNTAGRERRLTFQPFISLNVLSGGTWWWYQGGGVWLEEGAPEILSIGSWAASILEMRCRHMWYIYFYICVCMYISYLYVRKHHPSQDPTYLTLNSLGPPGMKACYMTHAAHSWFDWLMQETLHMVLNSDENIDESW